MREILIKTGKPYPVTVGRGIIDSAGAIIRRSTRAAAAHIVSDSNVAPLYADRVAKSLAAAGFRVTCFTFPAGEENKNFTTLEAILRSLAQAGLTRSDIAVALGGGVTGDAAGLAAALYLRGIGCAQIPTTLLAAVDSSVGGKTAVDFGGSKNSVGAFHQPAAVVCDCDTFATLPGAVYADGLAESIKYGVIANAALFDVFEGGEPEITDVVAACVAIKGGIVERDETDLGERRLLNFGHTPAHAIETLSGYKISHGSAVAAGMAIMARAAERAGICVDDTAARLTEVLSRYGLPTGTEFTAARLASAAQADKKRSGGDITIVLPRRMGECVLKTIPASELEAFFALGTGEA